VRKFRHRRVQGVRTSLAFSVQVQSSCKSADIVRMTLLKRRVQSVRTRAVHSKLTDGIIASHDNAHPHVAHRCHFHLSDCQVTGDAHTPPNAASKYRHTTCASFGRPRKPSASYRMTMSKSL